MNNNIASPNTHPYSIIASPVNEELVDLVLRILNAIGIIWGGGGGGVETLRRGFLRALSLPMGGSVHVGASDGYNWTGLSTRSKQNTIRFGGGCGYGSRQLLESGPGWVRFSVRTCGGHWVKGFVHAGGVAVECDNVPSQSSWGDAEWDSGPAKETDAIRRGRRITERFLVPLDEARKRELREVEGVWR